MMLELLITSTVLILGIFCLRKMTMGKISMRLRYALWILVAFRLLVPMSVGTSAFSVMNLLPETLEEDGRLPAAESGSGRQQSAGDGWEPARAVETEEEAAGERHTGMEAAAGQAQTEKPAVPPAAAAGNALEGQAKEAAGRNVDGILLTRILWLIWLLGCLTVSGYMVVSEWRFIRYLRKNRKELPAEAVPDEFAERFMRRRMKVYQVKGLPGPCLTGRSIYMGEEDVVQGQNFRHILAHEYCHALHGDGLWALFRCALAAVYWFDPFVWAAAYASKRDSELACDEAAVALLGEESRFAYGRTLLALLESVDGREKCPGVTFMTEGGETAVRARITALAEKRRTKGAVLGAVLAAVVLICGCAFTGAEREGVNSAKETTDTAADGNGQGEKDAAAVSDGQNRQSVHEEDNGEFARIRKEYEANVKTGEMLEGKNRERKEGAQQDADQAAFEEALNYHGVMEGKDDSELSLRRQVDVQAYVQYTLGEAENPMENGWYLLCEDQDAGVSLYGLYTEEFGFRGLKTLIGEDVNDFDGQWCASLMNVGENIRVLEQAQDGLPRRFVWKLLAEESSTREIWRFYSAYRYDTGTVEVKMLTEEDCLSWAKEHLSFTVDQEAAEVDVTYDGDRYLGAIDISAYADLKTEEVQIMPDMVSFALDDPGADIYQAYSDAVWEKTALHLAVGLKFAGVEGLWFNRLPVLAIQIAADEDSASGFRLGYPRIDETFMARSPLQEKELRDGIPDGRAAAQEAGAEETDGSAKTGKNDLEKPLVNEGVGHHDLAIDLINPCPDFERISDSYGERVHPVTGEARTHTGVDLAAAEGSDVLAAADGTVFVTGFDAVNGNYVVLWHGQSGQMTYYAHCKTVEAVKGQEVAQGEKIATVGQTGQATGPFLHFAVSCENNWEEPYFLELN